MPRMNFGEMKDRPSEREDADDDDDDAPVDDDDDDENKRLGFSRSSRKAEYSLTSLNCQATAGFRNAK